MLKITVKSTDMRPETGRPAVRLVTRYTCNVLQLLRVTLVTCYKCNALQDVSDNQLPHYSHLFLPYALFIGFLYRIYVTFVRYFCYQNR